MPSHKEFYDALNNISVNADTLNLNTDQVESKLDTTTGLLTTLSADTAIIKNDLANGVLSDVRDGTGNALTSATRGSQRALSVQIVDGSGNQVTSFGSASVSVSNFPATQPVSGTFWQATQPVSGTVTANAGTGSFTVTQATATNLNASVVQGTATNLKTQAENYQGGSAVGSANPLQVTLANTGANTTALQVRPRNGAFTVTSGSTSASANTSAQALASNSSRQYLLIQNVSDTDMYFNFGATATTDHLFIAKSGGGIVFESGFVPTDAVNVICSSASKKYYILSS
jgi:hypothetical protein